MAAPNKIQIFSWLLDNSDHILTSYVTDTSQSVVSTIAPVATTLFGIFVLLWGIAHLRNQIDEPVMDGVSRLIKVAIVLGLALNVGLYGSYVLDFAMNTPTHFIASINNQHLNGFQSGIGQVLDKAMSDGFDVGNNIWKQGGVRHMGYYIVALVIWLAVSLILLFVAGLILLAKVAMDVLLALGPLFIMLLLFNSTKRFFELWLGQVVNYMLMIILTMMAAGLVITILQHFIGDQLMAPGSSSVVTLVQMVALAGVGLLILRQVPSIASALAGGIAMSTLGTFGAGVKGSRGLAAGTGRAGAAGVRAGARAAMNTRAGQAARRGMANAFRRKNSISPV